MKKDRFVDNKISQINEDQIIYNKVSDLVIGISYYKIQFDSINPPNIVFQFSEDVINHVINYMATMKIFVKDRYDFKLFNGMEIQQCDDLVGFNFNMI